MNAIRAAEERAGAGSERDAPGRQSAILLVAMAATSAFTFCPTCTCMSSRVSRTTSIGMLKPTGDPRLFWLDELLETPEERAERDRRKAENIQKWGSILSQQDTFDESLAGPASGTKSNSAGEWALVAASAPILAALAAKAAGVF